MRSLMHATDHNDHNNMMMRRRMMMVAEKVQLDSEDACSSDAFMFAQQQKQFQLASGQAGSAGGSGVTETTTMTAAKVATASDSTGHAAKYSK